MGTGVGLAVGTGVGLVVGTGVGLVVGTGVGLVVGTGVGLGPPLPPQPTTRRINPAKNIYFRCFMFI